MPKRHHPNSNDALQKQFINKIILVVAVIQPLATIPQILTVFREHDASSISITSWLIYVMFDLLWLWYGIVNKQKAVIISAVLFSILEGIVMIGGFLYGGQW